MTCRSGPSGQGQPPSHVLVLATGLLAAAVASRRVWPVARTVVTIAHEGGHALAAVADDYGAVFSAIMAPANGA